MKKLISIFKSLSSKTKIFGAVGVFLCISFSALGQPSIEWQRPSGGIGADQSFSVLETSDGGYIAVGKTLSVNNGDVSGFHMGGLGFDFWVIKVNHLGVKQWQKCLGGSTIDVAYSIIQTTDGGFAIIGSSDSNDGDVTGNHGGNDFWIAKIDSSGNLQWQKSFGGTGIDIAYSIIQTADGGFAIVGSSDSNDGDVTGNHGGKDFWVVKINSTGILQWQKSLGGTGNDEARSIIQTTDGGYMVVGLTNSSNGDITFSHGSTDCWIVKLDPVGTLQWQKTYGGTAIDEVYSILSVGNGYVFAGATNSPNNGDVSGFNGGTDFWVVKIDSTGTLQWQKCLGGSGGERAFSITKIVDSGYAVLGSANSVDGDVTGNHGALDFWIAKIDSSGNLQWQKSFGGTASDEGRDIKYTADGGFITTGNILSNDGDVSGNHGNYDYWIIKLSCSQQDTIIQITDSSWIVNVIHQLDTVVVVSFDTTVNYLITTTDSLFIDNEITNISIKRDSSVVIANQCSGDTASNNTYTSFVPGLISVFDTIIHEYSDTTFFTIVVEGELNLNVKVYPNPVNSILHIGAEGEIEYQIFDLMGRLLLTGREKKINMSEFSSGIYLIKLVIKGNIYSRKIIKK